MGDNKLLLGGLFVWFREGRRFIGYSRRIVHAGGGWGGGKGGLYSQICLLTPIRERVPNQHHPPMRKLTVILCPWNNLATYTEMGYKDYGNRYYNLLSYCYGKKIYPFFK